VDRQADNLIKANAVVATVMLLIGGISGGPGAADALAGGAPPGRDDVLPRADHPRDEHADLLHPVLRDGHPVLRQPVLLNSRAGGAEGGVAAFGLMVVGMLMVQYTMFTGKADVLFTSYVPLRADPNFYGWA
jgi:cytochrome c oxidase subunit I